MEALRTDSEGEEFEEEPVGFGLCISLIRLTKKDLWEQSLRPMKFLGSGTDVVRGNDYDRERGGDSDSDEEKEPPDVVVDPEPWIEVGDIDWEKHFNKIPSIKLFVRENLLYGKGRFDPTGLFEWLNRWKDLLFFQFKLDRGDGQKGDLYDELVTIYRRAEADSYANHHYIRLLIWYERQRNSPETRPVLAKMMLNKIDLLWDGVSKERIEEMRSSCRKDYHELDLLRSGLSKEMRSAHLNDWFSMHDQLKKFYQQMGRLPKNPESKLYQWYYQQKKLPQSNFRRVLVDYIEM